MRNRNVKNLAKLNNSDKYDGKLHFTILGQILNEIYNNHNIDFNILVFIRRYQFLFKIHSKAFDFWYILKFIIKFVP